MFLPEACGKGQWREPRVMPLVFGSNGAIRQDTFVLCYNIMEKIQMTGFYIQELIYPFAD
jgi:hypothetical protein